MFNMFVTMPIVYMWNIDSLLYAVLIWIARNFPLRTDYFEFVYSCTQTMQIPTWIFL